MTLLFCTVLPAHTEHCLAIRKPKLFTKYPIYESLDGNNLPFTSFPYGISGIGCNQVSASECHDFLQTLLFQSQTYCYNPPQDVSDSFFHEILI